MKVFLFSLIVVLKGCNVTHSKCVDVAIPAETLSSACISLKFAVLGTLYQPKTSGFEFLRMRQND